jgi:hypothetical protein
MTNPQSFHYLSKTALTLAFCVGGATASFSQSYHTEGGFVSGGSVTCSGQSCSSSYSGLSYSNSTRGFSNLAQETKRRRWDARWVDRYQKKESEPVFRTEGNKFTVINRRN